MARINDKVIGNGNNFAERVYNIEFKTPGQWATRPHLTGPFKVLPSYYGDFREWNKLGHEICEISVNDDGLHSFIGSRKYNLSITADFDFCAIGIVSLFNIPSRVTSNPCSISALQSVVIGIPNPPSTTIPLFQLADITTLYGRFWNIINWAYIHYIQIPEIKSVQENIFKRRFGKYFDMDRALSKIDLTFINSNELMEKPRPLHHRFQFIGGINLRVPKPLNNDFHSNLSRSSNGTIIFSMGTQVPGEVYPRIVIRNFIQVFRKYPDYTFLWKYEIQHGEGKLFQRAKNVILRDWIPQFDLLSDPRVKGFISHVGLNSFNEASYAEKPLIAIPLFADQPHNAANGVLRGTTILLDKTQLSIENIDRALRTMLFDHSYRRNSQVLHKMLKEQPEKPKDRFIKWIEFSASNPGLHKIFKLPGIIGCTSNSLWLANFVIIAVLAITRIGITFFKLKADRWSLWIKISLFVGAMYILTIWIIGCVTQNFELVGIHWSYDMSVPLAESLEKLELVFCFPIMILSLFSYFLIIINLYQKKLMTASFNSHRTELGLIIQATVLASYMTALIVLWHNAENWFKMTNATLAMLNCAWILYLHVNTFLMIFTNRCVRREIKNVLCKRSSCFRSSGSNNVVSRNLTQF